MLDLVVFNSLLFWIYVYCEVDVFRNIVIVFIATESSFFLVKITVPDFCRAY